MNVGHHDARRSGDPVVDQLRPCPSVAAVANGRTAAVDARHESALSRRKRHPYLPSNGYDVCVCVAERIVANAAKGNVTTKGLTERGDVGLYERLR